mgnify:CR=1 FL=1
MFAKKNKILYSDWIYEWLIDKKEYRKGKIIGRKDCRFKK